MRLNRFYSFPAEGSAPSGINAYLCGLTHLKTSTMEKSELEMIKAALAVIWKRLNRLEYEVNGSGGDLNTPQQNWNEIQREAAKIISQIR